MALSVVKSCGDCGTARREVNADSTTGDLLCLACYEKRHPQDWPDEPGEVPSANSLRDVALGTSSGRHAFATRRLDIADFEPLRFAWEQRLVIGVLNLLAGTEGIGKGTLLAWVIAQLTRGELPGDLRGNPARVLWVGDEDSWTQVVGPRLYAAGADLTRVEELVSADDRLFNVHRDAGELDRVITTGGFRVVVFEALLDHMPANRGGDPTQHTRVSLAPTRAVIRRREVVAFGTLHTRKGDARSFRDKMAGSHQFNALSRSSLLIDAHPDDEDRRIIVAGKQNYSRASITQSFQVAEHTFTLGRSTFTVPHARDFRDEPGITIDSLLGGARAQIRDELADRLHAVLTPEPQQLAKLADAVDRKAGDGSVRRALKSLEAEGVAENPRRGAWKLVETTSSATLVEGLGGSHVA